MTGDAEREFERYKFQLAADLEKYKSELRQFTESQKTERAILVRGSLDFALAAIRGLLLINGGAAIALLAFLTDLVAKNPESMKGLAESLSGSMMFFVAGAGFSTLTAMLAYLAQRAINELSPPEGKSFHFLAHLFTSLSIITAIISFGLFAWGCVDASSAFSSI